MVVTYSFDDTGSAFSFLSGFASRGPFIGVNVRLFCTRNPSVIHRVGGEKRGVFLSLGLRSVPGAIGGTVDILSGLSISVAGLRTTKAIRVVGTTIRNLAGTSNAEPVLVTMARLASADRREVRGRLLVGTSVGSAVIGCTRGTGLTKLSNIIYSPLRTNVIGRTYNATFVAIAPNIEFTSNRINSRIHMAAPTGTGRVNSSCVMINEPVARTTSPITTCHEYIGRFMSWVRRICV